MTNKTNGWIRVLTTIYIGNVVFGSNSISTSSLKIFCFQTSVTIRSYIKHSVYNKIKIIIWWNSGFYCLLHRAVIQVMIVKKNFPRSLIKRFNTWYWWSPLKPCLGKHVTKWLRLLNSWFKDHGFKPQTGYVVGSGVRHLISHWYSSKWVLENMLHVALAMYRCLVQE